MYENPTGDSPFIGGGTRTIISNTHVQDARSDYYDIPYVTSGAPLKQTPRRDDVPDEAETHRHAGSASVRYNVRQWAMSAKQAAKRLENAAREEDFMDATSAGVELTYALAQLWHFRSSRESEFAEIINMLQIAMAKTDFETLTSDQCATLVEFLDECVLAGATDESEVRLARSLLRRAGFDPWRGLSVHED